MSDTIKEGKNLSKRISPAVMLSGSDLEYFSKRINAANVFIFDQVITDLYHCGVSIGYDLAAIEDGIILETPHKNWKQRSVKGNGIFHSAGNTFSFSSADLRRDINLIRNEIIKKKPLSDLISNLYYRGIMDGYRIYKSRIKQTAALQDERKSALSATPSYNFSIDYSRRHF